MQFHEYRTLRNQALTITGDDLRAMGLYQETKSRSSADHRLQLYNNCSRLGDENAVQTQLTVLAENSWVDEERPFYNIWPVAVDLARSVQLTISFRQVRPPCETLLLRFAKGHEPHDVRVAMLSWDKSGSDYAIFLAIYIGDEWSRLTLNHVCSQDDQVEEFLTKLQTQRDGTPEKFGGIAELLIRMVVFVGILANDCDVITPVVLSRDRNRYQTSDDETKKWLEDRAARKLGRGFDIARQLHIERDTTPHWRNPHLALYHTGPGGKKPVLIMRKGSIIQGKVSMAEVPTGYLGPETETD